MRRQDAGWVETERRLFRALIEIDHACDPSSCVREALAAVVHMSGADVGYIELYERAAGGDGANGTSHALSFSECVGADAGKHVSHAIIAAALAHGRTLDTMCACEDPRFEVLERVREHAVKAVICSPIGDPPVGVLYFQKLEGSGFRNEAVQLVELVARHVAVAADRFTIQVRLRKHVDATLGVRRTLKAASLIGRSPALAAVLEEAATVASADVNVLLLGPSGTGKTALARIIADNSTRSQKAFADLNCAAFPDTLIESELFGARRGAHSTASCDKQGIIAAANGGTLFLDEVGELSMAAQTKLLKFIETKTYWPLGASRPVKADVRIIAATNADLSELVVQGRFREDLLWRLNVFTIRLPRLEERKEDTALLARHFCHGVCDRNGWPRIELSKHALLALEDREWPGQLRELCNRVEAGVTRARRQVASTVTLAHLFPDEDEVPVLSRRTYRDALLACKRRLVLEALEISEWNVSKAARVLGIRRAHLQTLKKGLNIRPVHPRPSRPSRRSTRVDEVRAGDPSGLATQAQA